MKDERDYVLGTHDAEIERLGLQHRIWRPFMLDAFARAGIRPGLTVLDVGAGPGFAALDLAGIVGAGGRVIAAERSRRFLDALAAQAERRGLTNIETIQIDVAERRFGTEVADAAWCRWLLSFVTDRRSAIAHIAAALRPGGTIIFHEYADYGSWRTMPRSADVDRFRDLVMQSWRDAGGEPDVALELPSLLAAEGLEIVSARPLVQIVGPDEFAWHWPAAFMASGAGRLAELGYVEAEEADRFAGALDRVSAGTLMMTPLVAEIIARKRLRLAPPPVHRGGRA
jgi:SAM-dependent methyltransferase